MKPLASIASFLRPIHERYALERTYGFAEQGRGLRARSHRFAHAWAEHRRMSLHAQQLWYDTLQPDSQLIVLGAGSLWDFNLEAAASKISHITLVDIDRAVASTWTPLLERFPHIQFRFLLEDATGMFFKNRARITELASASRAPEQFCSQLEAFRFLRDIEPTWLQKASATGRPISLNLMSQLSLFWTRACEMAFTTRFGKRLYSKWGVRLLNALIPSQRDLIAHHCSDLVHPGHGGNSLVISDDLWIEYHLDKPRSVEDQVQLPISCEQSVSGSAADFARSLSIIDSALRSPLEVTYALTSEDWTPFTTLNPYVAQGRACKIYDLLDPWLWHIVPAHRAQTSGWVHLVRARILEGHGYGSERGVENDTVPSELVV